MFNAHFLFASLIWGSIGLGYFIYGKKQGSWVPNGGWSEHDCRLLFCGVRFADVPNLRRADRNRLSAPEMGLWVKTNAFLLI